MGPGSSMYNIMFDICDRWGFVPRVAIQSDDPFYIRRCVEMDLGVAFIPAISWKGQFSENTYLHRIENARRSTYAYWDGNKPMSACTGEFLQMLMSAFWAECDSSGADGEGAGE